MRHIVTIIAKRRVSAYENKQHVWDAHAEFDFFVDTHAAFLKGHFVDLAPDRLALLPTLREISLQINKQRYRLLLLEPDGSFVALRDDRA